MNIDLKTLPKNQLMNDILWEKVDHFTKHERWGNPYEMHVRLIYLLDILRKNVGCPIHIHCGYATDGHEDGSQHYYGRAADIHAEYVNEKTLMWEAIKLPFTGLGLYKHWNNPGIHVDIRPTINRNFWIQDRNGLYRPLNRTDLVFDR
jgi:uncharacterized protein YcbK (DUF882 family)